MTDTYIPGAGKGNTKDSGNLPGMGGIFNHINGNLYHYAANNPIRYLDPTGAYSVDDETKMITANLNDKKDMTAASRAFFVLQDDGYKCRAENSNDGNSITFNNAKGMYAFLDGNYDQYLKNNDFSFDELFLDIYSVATASSPTNSLLGRSNQVITSISAFHDSVKALSNFNNGDIPGGINSTADFVIDVVGYFGFKGACISIGLKYTKKGVMFSAT